ncbi:hypothetical protein HMPREF3289_30300 [Pseudomonas sp. HMSC75E02]|nr:hypothetical protein HMPREF3289_30300 [Pseudomonas sp. HMSC75E02]
MFLDVLASGFGRWPVVLSIGQSFIRATLIDLGLEAPDLLERQAGATDPYFGDAARSHADGNYLGEVGFHFSGRYAVGLLRFDHFIANPLRDIDAYVVGLGLY